MTDILCIYIYEYTPVFVCVVLNLQLKESIGFSPSSQQHQYLVTYDPELILLCFV